VPQGTVMAEMPNKSPTMGAKATHLPERAKVHFDEHRNDHHPDQNAHRQVDLRDREMPDELEELREELTERDARHDA
jgi:hypothetical protein